MTIKKLAIILEDHGLYIKENATNIDLTDNKGNVYDTLTPASNWNILSKQDGLNNIKDWLGY